MMMQNKLVPKRRFEGFNDEWEKIKVSEIGNEFYGGGTPKTNLKKYWNGDIPWIQSSDIDNGLFLKNYPKNKITYDAIKNSATRLITGNSIAIVTRVGVGKLSLVPYTFSTSQDFFSISKLNVFPSFGVYVLYNLLQKEKQMVQGTSIKGITKDDLLNKKVIISSSFNEQQKIGQFFKHLDDMIAIQQRKIDKTKALKSAYFVEKFPAEGESVPKRRFSGFTGEWEEYSLGELTKINTGGSDAQDAKENGTYPFFVRSEKIQRSDNYTFNGEAILIPGEGRLGEIYHHFIGKFDYHQRVYKISHFDEKLDGKFTFYTMHKTFKKHALKYTVKATVDSLRLPIITEYKLLLPTIKEQQEIGQFFKHLDEMIATHQQKLEKLKATKQAYLHEMFV